jgi:hypothetical protein
MTIVTNSHQNDIITGYPEVSRTGYTPLQKLSRKDQRIMMSYRSLHYPILCRVNPEERRAKQFFGKRYI